MVDLLPDTGPAEEWVQAAGGIWVSRFFVPLAGDDEGLFLRLLTLARALFGVQLAHVRLTSGHQRKANEQGPAIGLTLALAADVHTLLVSAALYWATLREVVRRVKHPDLQPLFAPFDSAASAAKTAREHIEHFNERIAKGRPPKYGPAMAVEVFRQATGTFDGTVLRFGDETFPLDQMVRAIEESAAVIAPVLREALSPRLGVNVDPA